MGVEKKVFDRLKILKLAPEQLSSVDSSIRFTFAISLASNTAKKRRSRGIGRKIQGLSPYVTTPLVSNPSLTSILVPAAQALRGLQKSQSGFGTHPSSPVREKQRMLPPLT